MGKLADPSASRADDLTSRVGATPIISTNASVGKLADPLVLETSDLISRAGATPVAGTHCPCSSTGQSNCLLSSRLEDRTLSRTQEITMNYYYVSDTTIRDPDTGLTLFFVEHQHDDGSITTIQQPCFSFAEAQRLAEELNDDMYKVND